MRRVTIPALQGQRMLRDWTCSSPLIYHRHGDPNGYSTFHPEFEQRGMYRLKVNPMSLLLGYIHLRRMFGPGMTSI